MPVAETFTFTDDMGRSLSDLAQLDTMVTMVDAGNFFKDYGSWEVLTDRSLGVNEDDRRNIVDLLVDQIEFANVIIVNKIDLVSPVELEQLEQLAFRWPLLGLAFLPAVWRSLPDSQYKNLGLSSYPKTICQV